MSKQKIYVDENPENLKDWAMFMKGEKLFVIDLPFNRPDGSTFMKKIIYEEATARQVSDIYADVGKNDGVDEMFERSAQLFSLCIKNMIFNNKAKGTSRYEMNEISVQDLTPYQKNFLEGAIAEGFGKSAGELQQDIKDNRRTLEQELRKESDRVAES